MAERQFNLNNLLVNLLHKHGVEAVEKGAKVLTPANPNIFMQMRALIRQVGENISSRLEIRIQMGKRYIIESFGDVDATLEGAIRRNLENLSVHALGPILSCFFGKVSEEDTETWEINGVSCEVYLGRTAITALGEQERASLQLPKGLFSKIETLVKQVNLEHHINWFRFYAAVNEGRVAEHEFLFNNEAFPEGQLLLLTEPWQQSPKFYSLRNFFILKQKD